MNAKWTYEADSVAFADGSGTYEEGWYAASPSTVGAGQSPDRGPFATRELAKAEAVRLAAEEKAG